MKSYELGTWVAAVLLLVFGATGWAGQTLEQFSDIQGRNFHEDLYEGESCVACHGSKKPLTLPPDDVCLDCHDLEDLVEATARPEEDKWQNPHNNLHYGKDVPCMECHGEHQERKPLCEGCHSFRYPDHKL